MLHVATPLSLAPLKALTFAAFPSSPVSSRSHVFNRVQRSPVLSSSSRVISTSARGRVSSNSPRFLGRVPVQDGDSDNCWYCAGMLKTARAFVFDTAEKHASPAPACTAESSADHPVRNCRKIKGDMLELARTFLKTVRSLSICSCC